MLLDNPVDDAVERLAGALEAEAARQRQPIEDRRPRQHRELELLEDGRHRRADLVGLGLDVGVEERAGDDGQRQAVHFARQIDPHTWPLARAPTLGILDDSPCIAVNAGAMKRRLHQPSLAQVKGAFARQQPFTQQLLRIARGRVPC